MRSRFQQIIQFFSRKLQINYLSQSNNRTIADKTKQIRYRIPIGLHMYCPITQLTLPLMEANLAIRRIRALRPSRPPTPYIWPLCHLERRPLHPRFQSHAFPTPWHPSTRESRPMTSAHPLTFLGSWRSGHLDGVGRVRTADFFRPVLLRCTTRKWMGLECWCWIWWMAVGNVRGKRRGKGGSRWSKVQIHWRWILVILTRCNQCTSSKGIVLLFNFYNVYIIVVLMCILNF